MALCIYPSSLFLQGFIAKFGTHYVDSAVFGGEVNTWVTASQSYAENATVSDYYRDSATALDLLFYKFGRVSEDSTNASSLSDAFKKNASMLVEILGGDPTAVDSGNFSQWSNGVVLAPVPINVTYRNVSELISHPTRRKLFAEAVEEYISSSVNGSLAAAMDRGTQSAVPAVQLASKYYATCAAPSGTKVPFEDLAATVERGGSCAGGCGDGACTLTQGHQFGGTMIKSVQATSVDACCKQCRSVAACTFFDFDTLGNACRLLSSKTSDVVALMHIGGAPNPGASPSPSSQPAPAASPKPAPASAPSPSPKPPPPTPAPSSLPILPALMQGGTPQVGRFFDSQQGVAGGSCMSGYSFSTKQTWQSVIRGKTTRYAIPDGFTLAVPSSTCLRSSASVISSTADVVAMNMLGSMILPSMGVLDPENDLSLSTVKGLFVAAQKNASEELSNFQRGAVVYELSLPTHVLSYDLSSRYANTAAEFASDINSLDAASNSTSEFMSVVSKYGGFYVNQETYGGYCKFQATFQQSSTSGISADDIRSMGLKKLATGVMADLGVDFDMDKEVVKARDSTPVSMDFYNALQPTFECRGGDTSVLKPSMWAGDKSKTPFQQWLDSVQWYAAETNTSWVAVPNSARVRPISDAIRQSTSGQSLASLAENGRVLWLAVAHSVVLAATSSPSGYAPVKRTGALPDAPASVATRQGVNGAAIVSTAPGVCNGNGDVGIGCGYDVTQLELYGTTIDPKKPVVQLQPCAAYCYADPPPVTDPKCTYCTYQNPGTGVLYTVPNNVYVDDSPISGGCYEVNSHRDYESYESDISDAYNKRIPHGSQSKTTRKIMDRFYEHDDSLSLMYKYLIWHSVQLVDVASSPTFDFLTAVKALPSEYDPVPYRALVDTFGTHVMTKAYMGGAAMLTTYFHKCFLEMYDSKYVAEETKTHFWFHYSDGSSYTNSSVNSTQWEEWSQTELVLLGGDAWSHGELEERPSPPPSGNGTIPPSLPQASTLNATDVAAWEKSIAGDKVVPLAADFIALSDFMAGWADPGIVSNVNRTISEYFSDVERTNANIAQDLVPKDPHITPDWCKPPVSSNLRRRMQAIIDDGAVGEDSPAMGCPALPQQLPDDVMEAYRTKLGLGNHHHA